MSPSKIRFEFNEEKATAAAAVLLKKDPRRQMPYIQLIKLLYIAERESLQRRGRPIVGDYYVSMKHGPVLGNVLNLIKADAEDLGEKDLWSKHIRKNGINVELLNDPGVGALSEAEVEILEEVFRRHRDTNRWDLCKFTHTFLEWRNPGESCLPIHPEHILRAVGKTEEEISEIAQETDENCRIDALLRGEQPVA